MKKEDSKLDRKDKKEIKALEKQIAELQELVSSLTAEKEESFAKLQRVSADYANYQKRMPRQIADSVSYEKERFVKTLLGAIDNFEHALANSEKAENLESFVHGIQIVHDEIINTLKSQGVERIESIGQKFDPSQHEALMQRSDENKENGLILEEYQKGYKFNDRVIRPARVIVNKITPAAPPQEDTQEPDQTEDQSQE